MGRRLVSRAGGPFVFGEIQGIAYMRKTISGYGVGRSEVMAYGDTIAYCPQVSWVLAILLMVWCNLFLRIKITKFIDGAL